MDKKSISIAGLALILLILIMSTSGCLEYFNFDFGGGTTYESHPTKVRYIISYGYKVNCSGTGEYTIHYDCDLPEILLGSVSTEILYQQDYESISLVNNTVLRWNISGKDSHYYELGIRANVEAESFLVTDLNGNDALTLQEIKTFYPNLVDQYCNEQSDNNIAYIDPDNSNIKSTAQTVLNQANSNNSFIVAKELFTWLKQNTVYQIHTTNNNVQPAIKTYQLGSGDCDDLSFLYISLCRSVGIPARFISGFLAEESNGVVSAIGHAWVEIFVGESISNDGWIPIECSCSASIKTEINQNFGVEDIGHLRLFKDDGSNESLNVSISGPHVIYDTNIDVDMTSFVEIDNYTVLESKELFIDKNGNRSYE